MEITSVTVDCENPKRVAEFWNEALRWGGVAVSDDGESAVCGPLTGGSYLEFIRVPEPKTMKNRLHLGCSPAPPFDLETELARLTKLGATIAWEENFDPAVAANYRNVVLADVEGNEFCLGGETTPGGNEA